MLPEDVPACIEVTVRAPWATDDAETRAWQDQRLRHLLATDPGGSWVAEDEQGIAGLAQALRREDVWGLSLLLVVERCRGTGAGLGLLEATLAHGAGARRGVIASSTHPAAMALYAGAGFALRPAVALFGPVRRAPAIPPVVEIDAPWEPWMHELARDQRGGGYEPDVALWAAAGTRVCSVERRGFTLGRAGRLVSLLAADEDAARALLEAHLALVPPGDNAILDFVTAGQDWAVTTGLRAGLPLSPDGPLFVRGPVRADRPWIPSGALL